ncbi:MAG: C40 family peptidase [Muribaculum sp.]|nr:C40 family peptidase [Muribaculum sp.]
MKFLKTALTAIIIASCSLMGAAQTTQKHNSFREAHKAAHKAQLADNKSRLDKSVINDLIKKDVKSRENSLPGVSAQGSILINDLLKEANRHIGKPYVHGAKGPSQFDCSGFTSYVYKQLGYTISPGSRIQYTQGKQVDRRDLRKGDLVFFTSPRSGKAVGHVGIVVNADNEKGTFSFIHASLRGVKISNFEGYYLNRYVGARRIIE